MCQIVVSEEGLCERFDERKGDGLPVEIPLLLTHNESQRL